MANAKLTRGEPRVALDLSLLEAATIRSILSHVAHGFNPLERAFANVSVALSDALDMDIYSETRKDVLDDIFDAVDIEDSQSESFSGCIRLADVENVEERLVELYS